MENIIIGGTKFTTFVRDGIRYLCTGEVTGKLKFAWSGEIADYAYVTGATSVVSGDAGSSIDELCADWLETTEFDRIIGVKY